jgi:hypothetical protein
MKRQRPLIQTHTSMLIKQAAFCSCEILRYAQDDNGHAGNREGRMAAAPPFFPLIFHSRRMSP